MSSRIDFYTKVHKALRASLFDLSQRAATTDYRDPRALQALAEALRGLLARLSSHAKHEATFIHPLLEAKTGAGRRALDAEHEALEAEQASLSRLLASVSSPDADARTVRGLAFYRALNAFIARYLEHLDREEAAMPVLWERCSDDELRSVMTRFGASRPLDEALADMGWMLPALSGSEQAELIGGMAAALVGRSAGRAG
jgi:iron-sulfur cluster repair protein YtfE (RIC family)